MEKIISLNNVLLVKDDVGRGKPCTVKLPPLTHTYGKPDNKDAEGVRMVTSSWATHTQSRGRLPATDFRKMNKQIASTPLISLTKVSADSGLDNSFLRKLRQKYEVLTFRPS